MRMCTAFGRSPKGKRNQTLALPLFSFQRTGAALSTGPEKSGRISNRIETGISSQGLGRTRPPRLEHRPLLFLRSYCALRGDAAGLPVSLPRAASHEANRGGE
jgi:hypothetical protein